MFQFIPAGSLTSTGLQQTYNYTLLALDQYPSSSNYEKINVRNILTRVAFAS